METMLYIFFIISCFLAGTGWSLLVGAIFSKKDYAARTLGGTIGTGFIAMAVFTFTLWLWLLMLIPIPPIQPM